MKILIADDDKASLLLLKKLLEQESYEVIPASDGKDAWEKYKRNGVSIALLDWMMPEIDSVELCQRIRELESSENKSYCYIIMVTARTEPEDLTKAMEVGADDFVSKPYDKRVLASRIRAGKRIIEATEKLKQLSITDELTGLYNRRYFFDCLKLELSRSQRYGPCLSLAILDIDGFKAYNDTYGHLQGDELLKSFANIIKTETRKSDIACRYGGDEFAIIMLETGAAQAREVVNRISLKLERLSKSQKVATKAPLGLSAGIAQYPQDTADEEHLVFLADAALYHSKRLGKARTTLVPEMEEFPKASNIN